jgi:hypothetical protein
LGSLRKGIGRLLWGYVWDYGEVIGGGYPCFVDGVGCFYSEVQVPAIQSWVVLVRKTSYIRGKTIFMDQIEMNQWSKAMNQWSNTDEEKCNMG